MVNPFSLPLTPDRPGADAIDTAHRHHQRTVEGASAVQLRVANAYRVIYEIHDQVLLVIVVDIGHRREIYDEPLRPEGGTPWVYACG